MKITLKVYPLGFGQGSAGLNGTGFQLLVIIFMMLFGVTLGQMVAALSPSVQVGPLIIPMASASKIVPLGGCLIQSFHWYCSRNVLWRNNTVLCDDSLLEIMAVSTKSLYPYSCGNDFDGATVSILSIVNNLLCHKLSSGLVIKCKPDEFAVFNPPANQTCSTWAQDFVNVFGGYVDNPSDSSACRYCQYSVGDQFFDPLNISFSNRWRDAFIVFAFFGELYYTFHNIAYKFETHIDVAISFQPHCNNE